MFSKELLLDAGDLDFFGSSRNSADTENDSDFLVCCGERIKSTMSNSIRSSKLELLTC
jgi:hypothetical protein